MNAIKSVELINKFAICHNCGKEFNKSKNDNKITIETEIDTSAVDNLIYKLKQANEYAEKLSNALDKIWE